MHLKFVLPFLLSMLAAFAPEFLWAQGAGQLAVPALTDPVMDTANLISSEDQALIRELILRFHQGHKGQLQVLTLPTLQGLTIEQASIQVADKWKLGDQKRDDGVLILVAAQERAIRIEVGQGLEGVLPDITVKKIISDIMVPTFRQKSPSQGILLGVYQTIRTIDPEFQADESLQAPAVQEGRRGSIFDRFQGLFFLIFIVVMILSNLLRPRRRSFWGGGFGGWGGGGGFGGGGGSWGGGGGGFSGGGASGNW